MNQLNAGGSVNSAKVTSWSEVHRVSSATQGVPGTQGSQILFAYRYAVNSIGTRTEPTGFIKPLDGTGTESVAPSKNAGDTYATTIETPDSPYVDNWFYLHNGETVDEPAALNTQEVQLWACSGTLVHTTSEQNGSNTVAQWSDPYLVSGNKGEQGEKGDITLTAVRYTIQDIGNRVAPFQNPEDGTGNQHSSKYPCR